MMAVLDLVGHIISKTDLEAFGTCLGWRYSGREGLSFCTWSVGWWAELSCQETSIWTLQSIGSLWLSQWSWVCLLWGCKLLYGSQHAMVEPTMVSGQVKFCGAGTCIVLDAALTFVFCLSLSLYFSHLEYILAWRKLVLMEKVRMIEDSDIWYES